MRIAMIGGGYVGLVSGACFAEFGTDVSVVETDPAKLKALHSGSTPIYEPGLDQLVAKNVEASRLRFTDDLSAALEGRRRYSLRSERQPAVATDMRT
jgi:UDPglucose 6-dehydrogenase